MARGVWRLVMGGAEKASTNMAIDEAIMMAVSRGDSPPTLRFYAWDPPAISIGYFQSLEREVDPERCRQAGFDIVRRPTGGRVVLHDDELTYSIAVKETDLPGSVLETYKVLSSGLVLGLRSLGIDAMMMPHGSTREHASAACFDSPSWYEVVCEGKKIVGSAQVRKVGTILQHGSIPLTFSADRLTSVLSFASERVRERVKATLEQKASGICEFMRRRPTHDEVARSLASGLSSVLGIEFLEVALSPSEIEDTRELLRTKYSLTEWNLKR